MHSKKSFEMMNLNVTDELTVTVLPSTEHGFLMPTKDVAFGYGLSTNALRSHKSRYSDEFVENVHFVTGVAICDTLPHAQQHQIFWTKAGVIRLGFFIRSERAKMFRDWAENLILAVVGHKSAKALPAPSKRRDNRLSQDRLINIMADVCQIEDKELRIRITNKLIGGYDYGTL